jgi:hypothetical protein
MIWDVLVTNREIFEIVVAEATGKSRAHVKAVMETLPRKVLEELSRERPEAECKWLLEGMRREMPQIRAWAYASILALRGQMDMYGVDNLVDLWAARGMFKPSPSSPLG